MAENDDGDRGQTNRQCAGESSVAGDNAAIAYLAGEEVETLDRVTGDRPSR
jgi:hypothetical protein